MKKLITLILTSAIILSVMLFTVSCDGSSNENDGDSYKFGIIAQMENGAFLDMKEGIISRLEEKGYTEENTEIVYKCAQGDATALSTICNSMDDGSYDAVFTIATPATQAFVNLESDTPCFFCAVSAPVAAGVITEMESPDKNATGTSNAIPTEEIIKLADNLTPGIDKFGFIYCTAQVNATNTVNSACSYLDSISVDYTVKTVENSDEVASITEALIKDGAKAIFVPNDSVVQSGITALAEICRDEKIPTYCSSATTVESGCLATLAIDDKGIGEKTADMAIAYLEGKAIEDIPAVVVGIDYCTVNESLAETLDVTVPDDIGYEVKMFAE